MGLRPRYVWCVGMLRTDAPCDRPPVVPAVTGTLEPAKPDALIGRQRYTLGRRGGYRTTAQVGQCLIPVQVHAMEMGTDKILGERESAVWTPLTGFAFGERRTGRKHAQVSA